MPQVAPVIDLVLLGGGHAQVSVLKAFGMRPLPGLRLTLVSRGSRAPYSGMLPGLIAGHYTEDDMHIDLRALAGFAGARFIGAEVLGLDLSRRQLVFEDRPPLDFDLLSINAGITPSTADLHEPASGLTPVKPIDAFNARWLALMHRVIGTPAPLRVAVVGGGAGGVELILAIRHRLVAELEALGQSPSRLSFLLASASATLLPGHAARVGKAFASELAVQGIEVQLDARIVQREAQGIVAADGRRFVADEVLWVTHAAAAPWLATAGLAVDAGGFVRVDDKLRSISHDFVFAAGDCASIDGASRPKSGVYAVRQGPPLAENLRRACLGRSLKAYRPQRDALAILATGPKHAVATRGGWWVAGNWVWRWKDFIDRRFMRRFQQLPAPGMASARGNERVTAVDAPGPLEMRCGGCGSKVGAAVLGAALDELPSQPAHLQVLNGLEARDDAAVTTLPAGTLAVHSIDGFRSFTSDAFVFGQVAAAHALSDLYAMGATPQSALAYATLPLAAPRLMQRDLTQLLAGAVKVLNAAGAQLVGGHTSESAELALALSVNGHAARSELRAKDLPRAGDVLILTKRLGTGVVMAGDMRGLSKNAWTDAALAQMVATNGVAAQALAAFDVHALTDVTGFGLAGHLGEMLRRRECSAVLHLATLPALDGARELIERGVRSSLYHDNAQLAAGITLDATDAPQAWQALIFDPQTSGGLLLALPADQAERCLAALREAGEVATAIGKIEPR